jgi:hypothetical protein
MDINLLDLTPIHDKFHDVILGHSSTPIGHFNLKVSCGSVDNKRCVILTYEVASFDIGYNCILGRPFLLKFMTIIHTAYAIMKMSDPKGVIIIKVDQLDWRRLDILEKSHHRIKWPRLRAAAPLRKHQ